MTMGRWSCAASWVGLLAGMAVVLPVRADSPDEPDRTAECSGPPCALAKARAHLEAGAPERALEVLKAAVSERPEDGDLQVALAATYLATGNRFWAIRTLSRRLAEVPDDCAARALLAWTLLDQAEVQAAREAASGTSCPGPEGGRLALVRALVAAAGGDRKEGEAALEAARRAESLWKADREALDLVTRRVLPDRLPETAWRIEIGGGYASNGLLGSPTDPASGAVRDGRTALGQMDAWVRLAPRFHPSVRPVLEIQGRGTGFSASEVRGLSWLDLSGRLGVSVGRTLPRALLAWRPDWLILAQGDRYDEGPVTYYAAHRAEVEVEATPWLLIFGGGGRRTFRERARTRWEADLGIGGRWNLIRPLSLLWAATGRVHRARVSAWNLWGGGALLALQGRLPEGLLARGGLTVAVDAYPDSSGHPPWGFPAQDRRDVLIKPGISLWSPAWSGLRVGIQYEFSWRDSTLPAYGFTDHRVTVRLAWAGDAEWRRPPVAPGTPAADLPWSRAVGEEGFDRIQDLLRQDEQVQRSSSCVQ